MTSAIWQSQRLQHPSSASAGSRITKARPETTCMRKCKFLPCVANASCNASIPFKCCGIRDTAFICVCMVWLTKPTYPWKFHSLQSSSLPMHFGGF
eukprot:1224240-Amphidinium_carterae.2